MPFLTELTNALHLERVIVHQLLHQVIRLILSVHATNAMNAFHVDRGKSDATVFATGSTVLIDGQPDLSRSFSSSWLMTSTCRKPPENRSLPSAFAPEPSNRSPISSTSALGSVA